MLQSDMFTYTRNYFFKPTFHYSPETTLTDVGCRVTIVDEEGDEHFVEHVVYECHLDKSDEIQFFAARVLDETRTRFERMLQSFIERQKHEQETRVSTSSIQSYADQRSGQHRTDSGAWMEHHSEKGRVSRGGQMRILRDRFRFTVNGVVGFYGEQEVSCENHEAEQVRRYFAGFSAEF